MSPPSPPPVIPLPHVRPTTNYPIPGHRLKPRTVVAIAPEAPVADEVMFCQQQGAQLLPIRAELYREEAVTITFQQVAQVGSSSSSSSSKRKKTESLSCRMLFEFRFYEKARWCEAWLRQRRNSDSTRRVFPCYVAL